MPLVITPLIENQRFCESAAADPSVREDAQAEAFCYGLNETPSDRIEQLLGEIGPALSPSGEFALGYTLNLPALSFFRKSVDGWTFDLDRLRYRLRCIEEVNRPVVVYISSNHFCDEARELCKELSEDVDNLMWTSDGPLARDKFFALETCAWNIADLQSPLNRMRKEAFEAIGSELVKLNGTARRRIIAVSILGEVHHHYANFSSGMGYDAPFNVTDYSPSALHGFRTWLKTRFGDIASLNGAVAGKYDAWEEIDPPRFKADDATSLASHSLGRLCFHGWAHNPGQEQAKIKAYVNGVPMPTVSVNLSRPDVAEAVPSVDTANVGWRWVWDFSTSPSGQYAVEITLISGGQEYLVAKRQIEVFNPSKMSAQSPQRLRTHSDFRPMTLRCHIDYPSDPALRVSYDPLARLWNDYREHQVTEYMKYFSRIIADCGIPKEQIFSHQILPRLNSAWNSDFMGTDGSIETNSDYNPGVTLYAGSAYGEAFFDLKRKLGWARYGVSELNPNRDLGVADTLSMIRRHAAEGAVYLSPYYLSMRPARVTVSGPHDRFWIKRDNRLFGCDTLYAALQVVMRHL